LQLHTFLQRKLKKIGAVLQRLQNPLLHPAVACALLRESACRKGQYFATLHDGPAADAFVHSLDEMVASTFSAITGVPMDCAAIFRRDGAMLPRLQRFAPVLRRNAHDAVRGATNTPYDGDPHGDAQFDPPPNPAHPHMLGATGNHAHTWLGDLEGLSPDEFRTAMALRCATLRPAATTCSCSLPLAHLD
jgi:hypothetical protein